MRSRDAEVVKGIWGAKCPQSHKVVLVPLNLGIDAFGVCQPPSANMVTFTLVLLFFSSACYNLVLKPCSVPP